MQTPPPPSHSAAGPWMASSHSAHECSSFNTHQKKKVLLSPSSQLEENRMYSKSNTGSKPIRWMNIIQFFQFIQICQLSNGSFIPLFLFAQVRSCTVFTITYKRTRHLNWSITLNEQWAEHRVRIGGASFPRTMKMSMQNKRTKYGHIYTLVWLLLLNFHRVSCSLINWSRRPIFNSVAVNVCIF